MLLLLARTGKSKMAALVSDWLSHLQILFKIDSELGTNIPPRARPRASVATVARNRELKMAALAFHCISHFRIILYNYNE